MKDLVEKLEQVEGSISHAGRLGGLFVMSERKKQNLTQLSKISQDGCKIATEQIQSMLSQTLKETLFNSAAQNQNEQKNSSQAQSLPVAMHD